MPRFAAYGQSPAVPRANPPAVTPAAGSPAWVVKWKKARAGGNGPSTDHYVARRIVGKLPSGATDPRATDPTIAAALAALGFGGGLVFLLEGNHMVTAPLFPNPNVDIRGAGSEASSVLATFVDQASYVFTAGGGNQFSDFQMSAPPENVLGFIRVGSHTVVRNVRFVWVVP